MLLTSHSARGVAKTMLCPYVQKEPHKPEGVGTDIKNVADVEGGVMLQNSLLPAQTRCTIANIGGGATHQQR